MNGKGIESLTIVWQSLLEIWISFLEHLPLIIAGIILLTLTWMASRATNAFVTWSAEKRKFKSGFKDLLRQIVSVLIWIAGITITAIVIFPGMTPAKVLAGMGLGSIAVGFAFKDVVENFLAGILILWKFPFDPGDYIRMGEVEGRVEEITIRMTLIRQTNGELVVLPNATLFKEAVTVLTSRPVRRVTVICGIAYGEDVDGSRDVIRNAVKTCRTVDEGHPIEIFAQEFASSSINFEVTWWCGATPLDVRRSRDEVVAAVKRALDDAGIEIPFPYRTLTFKEPLQTVLRDENASGEISRS